MTVLEDLAPPPRVDVRPRGMGRREAWQRRLPLLPALVYMVVVTQIPFVVTLWYSFQNYFFDEPGAAQFTGLSNYKAVFTSAAFRSALVRSVVMTVTAVIVAMILGVALAVLLDRKFVGRGIVRTIIITPFLIMPAAAALIWSGPMLDPNFGLLNYLLEPFGVNHVAWLSTHALGLGDRRDDLAVDAVHDPDRARRPAGPGVRHPRGREGRRGRTLGTFRELTLPHLRPYIELGILLGSIYLVNVFNAVRLMTNGGPGTSTTNLPFYLYQQVNFAFDVGGAAAAGVVTVILTIIVATFALRMFASVFQFEEAGV